MLGFAILPERFYSENELISASTTVTQAQGVVAHSPFTSSVLRAARDAGLLKYHETRRGVRLYLGQWLLDWIEGTAQQGVNNG